MKLLAQVPYEVGMSYDFYDDRFISNNVELLYEDISGYGYLLTNSSTSINFIPLGNSTSYSLKLFTNDDTYQFGKTASNFMLFKNSKQRNINLIFSELVKCVQAFIAPLVFNNCLYMYESRQVLVFGGLTLSDGYLIKKVFRGTKQLHLDEYHKTTIEAGVVKVYSNSNKLFYQCSMSEYNAPLIGPILDTLTQK